MDIFNKKIFTSLVCALRLSLGRNRTSIDVGCKGGCGGPLLCPPSTSTHVQRSFELVGLGGDMCSNCQAREKFKPELEFQADTSSYFQAGTSSYHALYKHDNIGYVEEYAEFGSKRRSLSVSNGRLR